MISSREIIKTMHREYRPEDLHHLDGGAFVATAGGGGHDHTTMSEPSSPSRPFWAV